MTRAGCIGWAVFFGANAVWSACEARWGFFPIEAAFFAYCAYRAATWKPGRRAA